MFEHDLGQYVKGLLGKAPASAVADSVTDNVKVTGATINRLLSTTGDIAGSAVVLIPYTTTLSEAETLSFAVELQESSNGSSWDTAEVLQASTVAETGGVGGSTNTGILDLNIDLGPRKQYLRINVTPNLSQADVPEVVDPPTPLVEATDEVSWAVAVVFGGYRQSGVV